MGTYRYMILRRMTQVSVMGLFISGGSYGVKVLTGNLTSGRLFGTVPLTDPFALVQIFATGAVPARDAIIGGLAIAAFYGLIGGRAFCGWVCPMNIVTDTAGSLRKYFGVETFLEAPKSLRYWVLGLSVVLSAITGVAAFEWISPVSTLHRGLIYGFGFGWMAVLAVFVFDLLLVRNGFCGHLCPLGGFYSLIGKGNFIKPYYDMDKCTMCMKCVEMCPENQVLHDVGRVSSLVRSGECINCMRCVEVCESDAITLGSRALNKKNK